MLRLLCELGITYRSIKLKAKTALSFSIGPIGAAAFSVITLPLITWFFSQEVVGKIALFQVCLSLSTLLFSLGLDQGYVREFHDSRSTYTLFKMSVYPGFFLLISCTFVITISGYSLSGILFDVIDFKISLLIFLGLISSYFSRFFSLVLRMHERGFLYSLTQLLPNALLLIVLSGYVFFNFDKSLDNLVSAMSASLVFVCLAFGWNTRTYLLKSVNSKWDWGVLIKLLKFGVPLSLGAVAFWGLTALDKLLLRSLSSFEELGIYSVAVSFAAAAAVFQTAFSTIWVPTVYKWARLEVDPERVYSVTRYILAFVVLIFSCAGLLSWVITLFLPKAYFEVQWLVLSCLSYPLFYVLSETTVVGIGIVRKSYYSMVASIISVCFNLIGNILLIPDFGAKGAAISTSLSFFIFLVLRTEFSIFVWKPIPRVVLYLFTSLCTFGAVFFTMFGERFTSLNFLYWSMLVVASIIVFAKQYLQVYIYVRSKLLKS